MVKKNDLAVVCHSAKSGWWLAPSQDACVVKADRNQIFDKALLYIVVRVYSYHRQPYRLQEENFNQNLLFPQWQNR